LVVTFKTEDGVTYKLDFEKTFNPQYPAIEKKMRAPEIFGSMKVIKRKLAFIDKSWPVLIGYPEGTREEITYNIYFSIADCMHLLERITDKEL